LALVPENLYCCVNHADDSVSPLLGFNAGKIDEFVTSLALYYTDRFGYQHHTIEGLRQLVQQAISGFGSILKDSFKDGATLTLPNELLFRCSNDEYYRWSVGLLKSVSAGSISFQMNISVKGRGVICVYIFNSAYKQR